MTLTGGNPCTGEKKTLPGCQFSHDEFHADWPEIGTGTFRVSPWARAQVTTSRHPLLGWSASRMTSTSWDQHSETWIYLEAAGKIRKWNQSSQGVCKCTDVTCYATGAQSNKIVTVLNLLQHTGHVMHQQFNIQQLYVLPSLYLCVLYLSENKQRLVPLTA